MKKKIKYILIFLFFTQLSFAQKIIDLKADSYILERGELFLYEQTKNNFNEISIYIEPDENEIQKIIVEKQRILENEIPKEVVKIDDLKAISYKEILDSLKGKIFTENTYDKRELNTLELYNDYFFKISTFLLTKNRHQKYGDFWKFYEREFTSYFILRLNEEKYLIIFVENNEIPNKWGYIIPFENHLRINWDRDYNFILENDYQISQDSLQILNNQKLSYQNLSIPIQIKDNAIYNGALGEKIFDKKFDTLYVIVNNIVVGKKNNTNSVYNLRLEDITPQGLRAIYPPEFDVEYAQILVKNEVKWLDYDGKIKDSWGGGRYGYDNEHSRKIEQMKKLIDSTKYKTIGKFIDNFARFELENGTKGWLDFYGKEYFDE